MGCGDEAVFVVDGGNVLLAEEVKEFLILIWVGGCDVSERS